ncbi:TRPM8 channel-associated factor homolog [Limulus polyphemus]|uniref:TRPM8 channel-associated factor homolog n=1 Tax=Limulus polyphemus TaxID=6850 RepID=A0ABM1T151_LIMPO|nr:TRPM8 channel-associated factor homolog [Limulus polyphemus]
MGPKGQVRVFCDSSTAVPNIGVDCYDYNAPQLKWLFKGVNTQNVKTVRLRGTTDYTQLKVGETIAVVWASGKAENKEFFQKLETFVTSGGALVIAETPWGYLQIQKGSIQTMPHYNFFKNVGLCYTGRSFSSQTEIEVLGNPVERAHLGRLMKDAEESRDKLQEVAAKIAKMISALPEDVLDTQSIFQDFFDKCEEHIRGSSLPTAKTPILSESSKSMLLLYDILLRWNGGKAPGIEDFPGDFESPPFLTKATISLTSTLKEIHPTGYYLPAGQKMKMTVKETDVKGWNIRIGCHSDNLKNVTKGWKRWPSIMVRRPLSAGETTISSPYGGSIYFESPSETKNLHVELESVVEAPYFDIKDPEAPSHWKNRKLSPGLWADLVGEHVIISLPSSSIRNFDHPTEALTFWDQVIRAYHYLRGTDINLHRRQWVVPDRQPSAGYMHAGYPVVTQMDISDPNRNNFVLNTKYLRSNGSWGLFHEFGHNMQRGLWTFQGTGEVTCNIFTLYAMDVICNIPVWIHKWLRNQLPAIRNYLLAGADFDTWKKKAGVALGIYAQLAHCFEWESYKKVFREYEENTGLKPTTNEAKIDLWYTRFSKSVNYDLAPLFEFWGFPLSSSAKQSVNSLQPFICEDEITSSAPERFEEICSNYPNIFVMEFEIPADCDDFEDGYDCDCFHEDDEEHHRKHHQYDANFKVEDIVLQM